MDYWNRKSGKQLRLRRNTSSGTSYLSASVIHSRWFIQFSNERNANCISATNNSWVAFIVFNGLRIESLLKFILFLFIQLKMATPRCPSSRADFDFCNLRACLCKNRPVILDQKINFPYFLGYWSLYLSSYKNAFRLTESDKYIFFFTNFLISERPAQAL